MAAPASLCVWLLFLVNAIRIRSVCVSILIILTVSWMDKMPSNCSALCVFGSRQRVAVSRNYNMCLRLACVRPSASTCALMRTRRHTMHDGVYKIESRSFELSWVYPCLRIVQTDPLYIYYIAVRVCMCVSNRRTVLVAGEWDALMCAMHVLPNEEI